ncbi:Transmembrane protein [Massilia sp. 9I]|nr:Transmembrane protein [Massilia sp. 9I]
MHTMKRAKQARSRLLAPLVTLAALILLVEAWTWDVGSRAAARMGAWPPLRWLEAGIRRLPAWAALCAFVLPGLLLLPVKLLALLAIAHGHALAGVAGFVVAKLGGAAVVARIYVLTLPTLLTLGWFARWHGGFLRLKDRLLAALRASHFWRQVRAAVSNTRRGLRRVLRRAGRQPSHLMRVLRRFKNRVKAREAARRQEKTETELP